MGVEKCLPAFGQPLVWLGAAFLLVVPFVETVLIGLDLKLATQWKDWCCYPVRFATGAAFFAILGTVSTAVSVPFRWKRISAYDASPETVALNGCARFVLRNNRLLWVRNRVS
jgi:hypothetical protein